MPKIIGQDQIVVYQIGLYIMPMIYFITYGGGSKLGFLRPVQQPGSYWDRSSELPLVGLEPTEVTAYD